jgi:hypothetical protein
MRRLGRIWSTGPPTVLTVRAERRRGGGTIRAVPLSRRRARRRWGVSGAPLLGLGARRRQALRRAVCSLWRTLPRSCSRSRSMMGSRWRPRRWRRSRLIAWRTQSPTGIAGRAPAGRRRSVIGERHLFLFLVSLAPEMWVTPPRPVAHQLVGGYNAMLGPIAPHFCCMVCSRDAQIATGIGTWIAHVSGSSRFNIGTLSQTTSLSPRDTSLHDD